ncbi:hypothetical protein O3M35_001327 [Rhynocoris fuscipes]|uniref:MARVEL domain-containing protein n=1 Tax=Rhynocoris fuscipes TaxID=488301 RepID=A0AAW1DRL8_9HEMI
MACASPALLDGTHWFLFVTVISFIATLVWVFIYLLSIREALTLPINWHLTELFNTGLLTVLYLIAFIVQLSIWAPVNYIHRAPNIAAGVSYYNFSLLGVHKSYNSDLFCRTSL